MQALRPTVGGVKRTSVSTTRRVTNKIIGGLLPAAPARPGGLLVGLALLGLGSLALPTAHAAPPAPRTVAVSPLPSHLVPRGLPRASRGGARTAPVAISFVTREVAVGPSFSGRASWYGGGFQGRRTASGERFDTHALTAASRTLPFGTLLRVCRDSRCVVVRINDRGPYVGHRILDLSAAAKRAIGMGGVAFVTATPIRYERVAVPTAAPSAPQPQAQPPAQPARPPYQLA